MFTGSMQKTDAEMTYYGQLSPDVYSDKLL